MTSKLLDLSRARHDDAQLNAATEWLLSELDGPASVSEMRALALKEISRPRDGIHLHWAARFLQETKEYL